MEVIMKSEMLGNGTVLITETQKRTLNKAEVVDELQRIYYKKESLINQSRVIAEEFEKISMQENDFKELLKNLNDDIEKDSLIILE